MIKAKTCEDCCYLSAGLCLYLALTPKEVSKNEPVGFECPLEGFGKEEARKARIKLKENQDKALLLDLYIDKKMSMEAISKHLNVKLGRVKYAMEKFNIRRRNHSEIAKAQWERKGWGK